MKLSTKGRYGLRAMVDLAVNSNGEHVSLCSTAERQNISENYLEQVFSILRKAGLVRSIKGAQGGYVLTDPPSKTTVGKILRALEGSLSVADEDVADNDMDRRSIKECIRINVWQKINENINQIVDTLTLEDLVNEYRKMNEDNVIMYYI